MGRELPRLVMLIACLAGMAGPVQAADLIVLSAGAITAVAKAVVPDFEASEGVHVVMRTDTSLGVVRPDHRRRSL
jgi:ABC-type molybdate transport system substrate-binding protein